MAPPADPFEITDDPAPAEPQPARRAVVPTAYLDGLNEEQRKAVTHDGGPLLVLAGAGTGKTRVLTTRIAHQLITGRARPSQVLAVTFTNKAAREMLDRVASLIGGAADGMWLGTFHSVGVRVLRRHAELVGLKSNFTILDTDDQTRLIKQLLQAEGIDDKKWPARVLSRHHPALEGSRPAAREGDRARMPASSPTARPPRSTACTRSAWPR